MTDGHEVYSSLSGQDLDRRILSEVEAGRGASQRSLARSVGVALGLTNLLLRRLARKGFIRIVKIRPNRVRYVITPAGVAEKARMTRAYLEHSLRFYAEARERVMDTFANISASWPPADAVNGKTVVFYGAGEIAEIGYLCIHDTDLKLVGVVDDERTRPFCGLPVQRSDRLRPTEVDGIEFGKLIVMSLRETDATRARLEGLGFDPERVCWL